MPHIGILPLWIEATVLVLTVAIGILATGAVRSRCTRNPFPPSEYTMLRALFDNITELMYIKDTEHRFLMANASLAALLGEQSPAGVLGKCDADYFPAEMAECFRQDELQILVSGRGLYNREEKAVNRDGDEIVILTTKVPLRTQDGKLIGIAGVGRDITVPKKMEQALREAELKYRGIFNKAVVGIFQCTPEGRFLSVNPSMAFSFGYGAPEEMVDAITDISTQFFASPERGTEFMMMMKRVGGVKNFECEAYCQDGKTIWLTMSTRTIRMKGEIIRIEGVCDDISERIQIREQILQTQKLEAVGQLAAGIAHEINTPTQYIADNIRFMKDNFADLQHLLECYGALHGAVRAGTVAEELLQSTRKAEKQADISYLLKEIPKALEQSLDGVGRIASIVGAMKEFSHPGTKGKMPLDLNHAIENAVTVCRNEWKYVAELEMELDSALPQIDCIPGEFSQVILNLVVNAAHAIDDATAQGKTLPGLIRIVTRNCFDSVEISISDTGTGIAQKVRGRIFDPFFTTKAIGKGTGQGLSIARSVVVDKHGGTLEFETELGKGSTFMIRLPHNGKQLPRKPSAL